MLRTYKLKEVSKLIGSGITPLRSNALFWENGTIPWLKTEQLGEFKISDTSEKITQYAIDETSIKVFPVNTISIAMYGEGRTRGNVSILKTAMTTNQACCNLVIDEKKADYKFVYYYLKTQYYQLRNLSSGVRKNLNSNDIKEFNIRLHEDLSTQQKIASVLSSLDSKIELNNHINTELEAMAKTLYDYWFVQFDFPDKNGKPYKTSGGKMVWNDELKREVPDLEGWSVDSLSNAVNIYDSKRIPLSNMEREKKKGKYPYYGATSIMDYVDDYIFDGEYILLAEDGSVMDEKGYPIVQYIWGKTWVNNHAHVLQPKIQSNNEYLFHLLKSISVVQIMTGSIQKKINQENLMNVKVIYPDNATLERFSKFATPIRKQLMTIYEENQKLSELRDWLLPMLMNGQVKVGEAKEMVRMAAEPEVGYGSK